MVSVLCYEYASEETIKAANRLLLTENADLPANRRSMFICSECGDIGCGAITALVVREGHSIVWKTFGYENNYEENILLEDYKQVGPFTFDLVHYERTLLNAKRSKEVRK